MKSAPLPPWHCPRCRKRRVAERRLCAECGEGLIASAYCPVCERYWDLAADTPCPKHDPVTLLAEPPRTEWLIEPAQAGRWVRVASCADEIEARLLGGRLRDEGIPTVIDNLRMGGSDHYLFATGGIVVKVPEALIERARSLVGARVSVAPAGRGRRRFAATFWLLVLLALAAWCQTLLR